MPIVYAREIWEDRQASIDERRIRRYTRVWRVITDDSLDGALAATATPEIPPLYSPYIEFGRVDLGARVRNIVPIQHIADPREWRVRVEYSSEPSQVTGQDPAQRTEDPLQRPTEFDWGFQRYRSIVLRGDLVDENDSVLETDVPITTSAGAPYDPPQEKDDSRLIITLTRNEAVFDAAQALDYQDAVNDDPWLGFAAGKLKINIIAKSSYESGIQFARVTYTIEGRREGWNAQIPDVGYEYLDDAGKRVGILLKNGDKPTQPISLNGAGGLRADDDTTIYYRRYRLYQRRIFANLNLP